MGGLRSSANVGAGRGAGAGVSADVVAGPATTDRPRSRTSTWRDSVFNPMLSLATLGTLNRSRRQTVEGRGGHAPLPGTMKRFLTVGRAQSRVRIFIFLHTRDSDRLSRGAGMPPVQSDWNPHPWVACSRFQPMLSPTMLDTLSRSRRQTVEERDGYAPFLGTMKRFLSIGRAQWRVRLVSCIVFAFSRMFTIWKTRYFGDFVSCLSQKRLENAFNPLGLPGTMPFGQLWRQIIYRYIEAGLLELGTFPHCRESSGKGALFR